MLLTTGSVTQFTSTEKTEVLLLLVNNQEVLTRVTYTLKLKRVEDTPGRSTILFPYGDTENKCDNNSNIIKNLFLSITKPFFIV